MKIDMKTYTTMLVLLMLTFGTTIGIASTEITTNTDVLIPADAQVRDRLIPVDTPISSGTLVSTYPTPPTGVKNRDISRSSTDTSDVIDVSTYQNQISSATTNSVTTNDPGMGTNIYPNPRIRGVYAGQEIHPDYELPEVPDNLPSLVLYAPTMAAPNSNPLEITTVYYKWNKIYKPEGITEKGIGIWDHSKGYFVKSIGMDSANMSKYTAMFQEGRLYFATIMKSGNEWQALLYNFKTNSWEKMYGTTSTQPAVTNGWDSFETKNFNSLCPYVPDIDSTGLQVYDKGGLYIENGRIKFTWPGWYMVSQKYGYIGQDKGNCDYKYDVLSQAYHWKVSSPEQLIATIQ